MDQTGNDPEPKRLKLDENSVNAKKSKTAEHEGLADTSHKVSLVSDSDVIKPLSAELVNSDDISLDLADNSSATIDATSLAEIDDDLSITVEPKSLEEEDTGVTLIVEKDVGITEFISKHEGFSGIIKQRFSDFLVNEISLDEKIVHLTDTTLPATISDTSADKQEVVEQINSPLTTEDKEKLKRLTECRDTSAEVLIKVGADKQLRGEVHKAIRTSFPELESQTIERDNEKFVCVKFVFQKDNRRPDGWKKSEGDYTKFVLYKENMDTLEAINIISKCLRVKSICFTYAGTKDRRAKTCQEITGYRIMPQRLSELNRRLSSRKMVVGNFRQCKEPLKLGDLKGNRFVIVLRNVTGSDEQIEQAMSSLVENGFINYYGMQRFGTTQIPTHRVGCALLKCNWSEAIDLILQPRDGDRPELARARKIWQDTHDAKAALKELKYSHSVEKQLLEGLQRYKKNDLVSALGMVPRNMRLMYIHAYQSYVWNQVSSRRLAELGYKVCVGDLVLSNNTSTLEECDNNEQTGGRQSVAIVTADNISQFTMFDVVLPLPGYDVKYPQNSSAQFYSELMKNDNMESYNFRHHIRDYALPGSYRRVVIRPADVTWDVIPYNDYQISLALSDHDTLLLQDSRGKQLQHVQLEQQELKSEQPECVQQNAEQREQQKQDESKAQNLRQVDSCVVDSRGTESEGSMSKYRALKIEMNLPSSSYATMAIREVLKCGTSSAYQATLNAT